MPTDTTERGLEDLIVAAMTKGAEPSEPTAGMVRFRSTAYAPGWLLGDARDYNREYAVDLVQLAAFLRDHPAQGRGSARSRRGKPHPAQVSLAASG